MSEELNLDYVLRLKMTDMEGTEWTICEYLSALLVALWEEGESFSGKRPLGNSGWEYELYEPLIKHKVIEGELDEFGHIESVNTTQGDKVIKDTIEYIFNKAEGKAT